MVIETDRHRRQAMMTPAQFDAWLTHMGLSERRAAEVLGVAPSTIGQWRRVSTPPLLGLACAALAAGLKPWVPPAHAFGAGVRMVPASEVSTSAS